MSKSVTVSGFVNDMYDSTPTSTTAIADEGSPNTVSNNTGSLKSKGFVRGGSARASAYCITPDNTVEVTADNGPVYAIPLDVEYLQVGVSATSTEDADNARDVPSRITIDSGGKSGDTGMDF